VSIRNFIDVPDDQVPAWVRERDRAWRRQENLKMCSCNLHFGTRNEVLNHCDATGHRPLVVSADDRFIKRTPC
jgi:hypothetical protein